MNKPWIPSSLEKKCLGQLDHQDNWRLLDRERPGEAEILPWKPFQRIFWFNFVLFGPVIAVLLVVVNSASGGSFRDAFLLENLIPGLVVLLLSSVGMSLFAANLYRQSWNRRAKWLIRLANEPDLLG